MVCRLCKREAIDYETEGAETWVTLASPRQKDLSQPVDYTQPENSAFAHLTCCMLHGLYCVAHTVAHTRILGSDVYVCTVCIEQRARMLDHVGKTYRRQLKQRLTLDVYSELEEFLEMVGSATNTTDGVSLMRAILLAALKLGKTPDETVAYVIATQNVHPLIPHPLGIED